MNSAGATPRQTGLRHKLFLSHLAVALFCFAVLIAALSSSLWLGEQSKQLAAAADPTRRTLLQEIHNAVEEATSLTFQYVAMPEAEYRQRWWNIWDNRLWPALAHLAQDDAIAMVPSQAELGENLKALLAQLETRQWQILEVRNSLGNHPAQVIVDGNALGVETRINNGLNVLLDRETAQFGNSADIETMKQLADLRAAFIRSSISLHRFVNSATPAVETDIKAQQGIYINVLNTLLKNPALPAPQRDLLMWLEREFMLYSHYVDTAVAARNSEEWDIAQHLLIDQVIPLSEAANDLIGEIMRHHANRITQSSATVFSLSELNVILSVVFLFIMLLAAWFSARYRADRIMAPIESLVSATRKLAQEQRLVPLPVQSDDELGALTESFNQMQRSLLQKQAELHQLAITDPLTKLANRRVFTETIEREWKRCQRDQAELAVIMIDVDYFKQFNDQYGHQTGDHALCAIADILRANLHRPCDLAARYGGEEFIVILPETDLAGARKIAAQICREVTALRIQAPTITGNVYLSVSCGVSSCRPDNELDWEGLIKAADHALYGAKSHGRNCVSDSPHQSHLGEARGSNSLELS